MKLDWGEDEKDSLQKLKEAITEAPQLGGNVIIIFLRLVELFN